MPLNNLNNNKVKRLQGKQVTINIPKITIKKLFQNIESNNNFTNKTKLLQNNVIFSKNLNNDFTSTNSTELSQNNKTSSQNSSTSDFFLSKQDKTLQELLEEDNNYLKQSDEYKIVEGTSAMSYLNLALKPNNKFEELMSVDQVNQDLNYIYNQEIEFSNLYNEIKNIYGNAQLSLELEINLSPSNQEYKNKLNQIKSDMLKELSEIQNPFEIKLKEDGSLDVDYYFNTEYKKDQTKRFLLSDDEYKNILNNIKEDYQDCLDFPEILISPQCTIDDLELITGIIKNHQCHEKK